MKEDWRGHNTIITLILRGANGTRMVMICNALLIRQRVKGFRRGK